MSYKKFLLTVAILFLATGSARAGDIIWSGRYRVEGTGLFNTRLDSDSKREKSFMLHHLVLEPRIIAADGVNIFGRFDLFNASAYSGSSNQLGQFMGQPPVCGATDTSCKAVLTRTQQPEQLAVTHLYLRWSPFEFGTFYAGRMPVQFGLGIQYNAGNGLFDHWLETKDLIAYKFVLGNFFIMPMYGKVREGVIEKDDDINDYIIQGQWENPETDLTMGIIYESRVSAPGHNDAPAAQLSSSTTPAPATTEGWSGKQFNIFVKKNYPEVKVGVEAGFQSGKTGVTVNPPNEVTLEGYGLAGEVSYQAQGSRNMFDLKAGMATGDDPNSTEKYEGYIFSRNYDVAMMMFNYYLGSDGNFGVDQNVLGTRGLTGSSESTVDTDSVSNTLYIAPGFQRSLSDQFNLRARLIYATLNQARQSGWGKSLGTEFDLGFEWLPIDRMSVRLDLGMLAPGDAFSAGGAISTSTGYGVTTKAAISF